jgi:hypothetical protein
MFAITLAVCCVENLDPADYALGRGCAPSPEDCTDTAHRGTAIRLLLARVGECWVAHPLSGDQTLRTELLPADAEGRLEPGQTKMPARLLEDVDTLAHTVVVAGCTPALALWARSAERWHPGLRVHWLAANSTTALESLARGEIHAAGTHRSVQSITSLLCGGSCGTVRWFSSPWVSGKQGSSSAQAIHAT